MAAADVLSSIFSRYRNFFRFLLLIFNKHALIFWELLFCLWEGGVALRYSRISVKADEEIFKVEFGSAVKKITTAAISRKIATK